MPAGRRTGMSLKNDNLILLERIKQLEDELQHVTEPIIKEVTKEVIVEIPVIKEVVKEVIVEKPVIKEVIKEVRDEENFKKLEEEHKTTLSKQKAKMMKEVLDEFNRLADEKSNEMRVLTDYVKQTEYQLEIDRELHTKELENQKRRYTNDVEELQNDNKELTIKYENIKKNSLDLNEEIKKKDTLIEELQDQISNMNYEKKISQIQHQVKKAESLKWERLSAGGSVTKKKINKRKPTPFHP